LLPVRLLLVVTIAVLSACGPEPSPVPSTTQAGPVASEPSEPLQEELRLAHSDFGTETLDPIAGPDNTGRYLRLIFDQLIGMDYSGTELSKDTGIAEDWQVSSDGMTYTFTIREGVPWQDPAYGTVTAEDVKFTLERLCDLATGCPNPGPDVRTTTGSVIASYIESVTVNSPTEVEVQLLKPFVNFIDFLSAKFDVSGLVVSKQYWDDVGAEGFAENPMGSGPYKLIERKVGTSLRFEAAFPEHWAIGEPRFRFVTQLLVSEEASRIALLEAGDVDWIETTGVRAQDLEGDGFQIWPSVNLDPLEIHFQPGPWKNADETKELEETSDINLRKALAYAIDREAIREFIFEGLADPMNSPFLNEPGVQARPEHPFDLEMARASLAETPWGPGGEPLTLQIQGSPRSAVPEMLTLLGFLQDSWKEIGIDSVITYRDYGAFRRDWRAGDLPRPAVIVLNFGGASDYSATAAGLFTCQSRVNAACEPEFDDLVERWQSETDPEEYQRLADEADKWLTDNYYLIMIAGLRNPYYAATNVVRSDYSPGTQSFNFNVLGLVWNP